MRTLPQPGAETDIVVDEETQTRLSDTATQVRKLARQKWPAELGNEKKVA